MLWPPNHEMVEVGLRTDAVDICAGPLPVAVEVWADEDDEEQTGDGHHSPDATFDPLRLRAERKGNGDGRVYLIRTSATDPADNTGYDCCTVTVPKSPNNNNVAAVIAQAQVAEAICDANGTIPPGFVLVGDGQVLGPQHQRPGRGFESPARSRQSRTRGRP